MGTHRIETKMLAAAGRLLLEYNEFTGMIECAAIASRLIVAERMSLIWRGEQKRSRETDT
jgi:hypothetical protein